MALAVGAHASARAVGPCRLTRATRLGYAPAALVRDQRLLVCRGGRIGGLQSASEPQRYSPRGSPVQPIGSTFRFLFGGQSSSGTCRSFGRAGTDPYGSVGLKPGDPRVPRTPLCPARGDLLHSWDHDRAQRRASSRCAQRNSNTRTARPARTTLRCPACLCEPPALASPLAPRVTETARARERRWARSRRVRRRRRCSDACRTRQRRSLERARARGLRCGGREITCALSHCRRCCDVFWRGCHIKHTCAAQSSVRTNQRP